MVLISGMVHKLVRVEGAADKVSIRQVTFSKPSDVATAVTWQHGSPFVGASFVAEPASIIMHSDHINTDNTHMPQSPKTSAEQHISVNNQ